MAKHQYDKLGDNALGHNTVRLPVQVQEADSKKYERAASALKVGDGAMILRSNGDWRCAMVTRVSCGTSSNPPYIGFTVSADGSTKKIPCHLWGAMVRPLKKSAHGRNTLSPDFVMEKINEASPHDTEVSSSESGGSCFDADIKTGADIKTDGDDVTNKNEANQRRRRRATTDVSPLSMSHLIKTLVTGEEVLGNKEPSDAKPCKSRSMYCSDDIEPAPTKVSKEGIISKGAFTKLMKDNRRRRRRATTDVSPLSMSHLIKTLVTGDEVLGVEEPSDAKPCKSRSMYCSDDIAPTPTVVSKGGPISKRAFTKLMMEKNTSERRTSC